MTGRKPPTGKPPPRRRTAASASRSAAKADPPDTLDAAKQARLAEIRAAAAPLREKNKALAAAVAETREAVVRRIELVAKQADPRQRGDVEPMPGATEWRNLPAVFAAVERVMARWAAGRLDAGRIAVLAERIATQAIMARAEQAPAKRLAQRVKRAALALAKLPDAKAMADGLKRLGTHGVRDEDGLNPRVVVGKDDDVHAILSRGLHDAAARLGLDPNAPVEHWIARALVLFNDGPPEGLSPAQSAFAARIGGAPEPSTPARGAPARPAIASLAGDLGQTFRELTGRAVTFTDIGGDPPATSFAAFVAEIDKALPVTVGTSWRLRAVASKRGAADKP